MTRRRAAVAGLVVLAVAGVVFRHELERAVLLAATSWAVWRLVVGRTRRRRPRGSWPAWIEAVSLAWIAARMPPKAKRENLSRVPVTPIGSLQPVYSGRDTFGKVPAGRLWGGSSQGDEIPF